MIKSRLRMPGKRSATSEIRALVEALASNDQIRREAAIARLAIIGTRAVDRLATIYPDPSTTRDQRIAMLRVFEAVRDPRTIAIARAALLDGGDVAVAAVGALRNAIDLPGADHSSAALDALVTTALDRAAERRVRLAAVEALHGVDGEARTRIAAVVADDLRPSPQQPGARARFKGSAAEAVWQDAIEGHLPDDPAALRAAVQSCAGSAALGSLHKLVDAAKRRETETAAGPKAQEWRALRGALHQALASRGSNVALYDLRETVASADSPLPPPYLAALQTVGDESCLEAIAAAHSRAGANDPWRHQLATAFGTIARREKAGRNRAAMKRIAARWPDSASALSTTWRTTPRPKTRRHIARTSP